MKHRGHTADGGTLRRLQTMPRLQKVTRDRTNT